METTYAAPAPCPGCGAAAHQPHETTNGLYPNDCPGNPTGTAAWYGRRRIQDVPLPPLDDPRWRNCNEPNWEDLARRDDV